MKMHVGVLNNRILQATLLIVFYVRCAVVRHTKRREDDHAIFFSCGVELEEANFFTGVLLPTRRSRASLVWRKKVGGGRGEGSQHIHHPLTAKQVLRTVELSS